jgi:hypothetical protein
MKVTVTFEFDDGAERSYVFHRVETPDESSSTHRTVFKVEPHYDRGVSASWPPDLALIPPLVGASVGLSFFAQPDYERGEVYRCTVRKAPVSMTSTMCWACGQNRAVTRDGVFAEHGVNHDGSGDKCRGSGTDGPPYGICGYCTRRVDLTATGRFVEHVGLVPAGVAPQGGRCRGSGRAPEETTG